MRPDLIGLSGFRPNGQMGTGFDTKSDLTTPGMHMREPKPYKCSHCVKSFANSSYLAQHMRIHLGIKPFGPCTYCGKKFTQLSHLQQHIRTHTGEKPYRCKHPGCEKAFSQLSNLQSHSRCHQADKPFKCNSCYKCFTDENSLLEHIPKHKESKHLKIHICSFCGKSYTQSTYLAKHMTKHSDRQRIGDFNRIRNEFGGEGLDGLNAQWNGLGAQDQFGALGQFPSANMISQAAAAASQQGSSAAAAAAAAASPSAAIAAATTVSSAASPYAYPGTTAGSAAAVAAANSMMPTNPDMLMNMFNFKAQRDLYDNQAFTRVNRGSFNMITPLENIQRFNNNVVYNS
ncbi:hypothetical protein L596_002564 [Steinernema carpocapsae]|uniref:C2H2-type domain-containing protein n=1 Tax=Steinernema carpocapsae TaxID=34508 RepID=A0A4U8USH0_STECR|nr:hypothetical protein L596_002564 [Steinernema carpocapsae]